MTNINLNFVDFLLTLNNIKGASFVGIKNYFVDSTRKNSKCIQSGYKNMTINVNVNRENLKNKDRNTLLELDKQQFFNDNVKGQNEAFTFDLFNKAFNTVFDQCTKVGQKLANGTIKAEKTNGQKAHENVYSHIATGLKVHNETKELYISGVFQSSTKSEGKPLPIYKSTNKRVKTLVQDIIKDKLNLKSFQYRTLVLNNTDKINTSKTTFNGQTLTIGL